MSDVAVHRAPLNPWMLALTVLWCGLLAISIVLCLLAANAAGVRFDDALAGAYWAASAMAAGLAAVVAAVQLGVAALRWYLDPASRPAPVERERRPYVRQDF